MLKTEYYKPIEIWERKNDGVLECYQIFQRLSDSYFAVQSKDCYLKNELIKKEKEFEIQKKELFLEEDINERGIFKESIYECIQAFNNSFF